MKRFLCVLMCAIFLFTSFASAEDDYTVADKLVNQVEAGSGFSATLSLSLEKGGLSLMKQPMNFSLSYIRTQSGADNRLELALMEDGKAVSALNVRDAAGDISFQADLFSPDWYRLSLLSGSDAASELLSAFLPMLVAIVNRSAKAAAITAETVETDAQAEPAAGEAETIDAVAAEAESAETTVAPSAEAESAEATEAPSAESEEATVAPSAEAVTAENENAEATEDASAEVENAEATAAPFAEDETAEDAEVPSGETADTENTEQDAGVVRLEDAYSIIIEDANAAEDEAASEATEAPVSEVAPEATPETTEEAAPEATEEAVPEAAEAITPETAEEIISEVTEEATPKANEETAPEVTETTVETAPEATEETAPEVAEDAAPDATEETAPETTDETAPEVTETTDETAPEVTETAEETAPEATDETASEVTETTEETAPEATEETAPEATEETSSEVTETTDEIASEDAEEAAPETPERGVPEATVAPETAPEATVAPETAPEATVAPEAVPEASEAPDETLDETIEEEPIEISVPTRAELLSLTGAPELTSLLLQLYEKFADADLDSVIDSLTTHIDLWLDSYRSETVLSKEEDGSSVLNVNYTVPSSAIKAEIETLLQDVLANEEIMTLAASVLTPEEMELYLNKDYLRYYVAAVEQFPLQGEMNIWRKLSTLTGETVSLDVELPLSEPENGNLVLSYSYLMGTDGPARQLISLRGEKSQISFSFMQNLDSDNHHLYSGSLSAQTGDAIQSLEFSVTSFEYEGKSEDGSDLYRTELDIALTPGEQPLLLTVPVEAKVNATFTSASSKKAATYVNGEAELVIDDAKAALSFSGKTQKKWDVDEITEEAPDLFEMDVTEVLSMLVTFGKNLDAATADYLK